MTTTHRLKTWPRYFGAVAAGSKTFEVRYDDRGYQAGDTVVLAEWDPEASCECGRAGHRHDEDSCARYTGREITAHVGWVTGSMPRAAGQKFGFEGRGYVVLALVRPQLTRQQTRSVARPAAAPVSVASSTAAAMGRVHAAGEVSSS